MRKSFMNDPAGGVHLRGIRLQIHQIRGSRRTAPEKCLGAERRSYFLVIIFYLYCPGHVYADETSRADSSFLNIACWSRSASSILLTVISVPALHRPLLPSCQAQNERINAINDTTNTKQPSSCAQRVNSKLFDKQQINNM